MVRTLLDNVVILIKDNDLMPWSLSVQSGDRSDCDVVIYQS